MNITILAVGSRGDVQPFVAVGLGLKAAGHHVKLATHSNFEQFVTSRGLTFAEIKGNPREWLDTEEGLQWLESGPGLVRFYTGLKRFMEPVMESLLPTSTAACRDSDIILYSIVTSSGPHIGERLRCPSFPLMLQPAYPTWQFPSVIANSTADQNRIVNRLTHLITDQILHQATRSSVNRWRKQDLGLPSSSLLGPARLQRRRKVPHFLGYSPLVVPRPRDWDEHVHVTGYWFLDRENGWQPPEPLTRFLESGPPPVCVGFGSMTIRQAEQTTHAIVNALDRCGMRGILMSGWGELGACPLPPTVLAIDSAPHDWLFPRMAAVVHHGGAGTTAAALRAGIPSVVIPFFADQFYWGSRVTKLGVGPATLPFSEFNEIQLADRIQSAVTDPHILERSRKLATGIASENGVDRLVETFQKAMKTGSANGQIQKRPH